MLLLLLLYRNSINFFSIFFAIDYTSHVYQWNCDQNRQYFSMHFTYLIELKERTKIEKKNQI